MNARQRTIQFFQEHAGYATPPGRMACAAGLADAEAFANECGWTARWEWDEGLSLDDVNHDYWCKPDCGKAHEILSCVLVDAEGQWLASLGGIIDPSREYARVIEAELASEAIATIQTHNRSILARGA